jgi:hypothetical protein
MFCSAGVRTLATVALEADLKPLLS